MNKKYLLLLMMCAVMVSCKKNKYIDPPPPPVDPVPTVLLKDIVIPNLPSPYYHFEYNSAGKPTLASFASGFAVYNIIYSGGRISEMQNIAINNDRLQYFYDNSGRAILINYVNAGGVVHKRVHLSYDGQMLIKTERELKIGTDFVADKTMTMSYQADGNLQEIAYHLPAIDGLQPESNFTDRFEEYDNKLNTYGFSLLHNDFFDQLILLPGVELQKNNPGKEIRGGDVVHYEVDYAYTYNEKNAPLTQVGAGIILTGPDAGQSFQTNSVFSYY
jgi:hypothetical protein